MILMRNKKGKSKLFVVKRSWSVFEANEWSSREAIVYIGSCAENAERQFEMLYATQCIVPRCQNCLGSRRLWRLQ
jgi:hypothetical protein